MQQQSGSLESCYRSQGDLKCAFLENLRLTCVIAASHREPRLLILIGHGEEYVYSIRIGSHDDDVPETALPQDIRRNVVTRGNNPFLLLPQWMVEYAAIGYGGSGR